MDFFENIKNRIKRDSEISGKKKNLILPEGEDKRTLHAAEKIYAENLTGKIVILGNKNRVDSLIEEESINTEGLSFIDITENEYVEEFAAEYFELRKHKGITEEDAEKKIREPLSFGAMMVRKNMCDCMVAGAVNTTGDLVRAAIQIIGTAENVKTVSSSFAMIVPDCEYGNNGNFIFADCAVIPVPDASQLADIAYSSAQTFRKLFSAEPYVAMLSFSTKGSASHNVLEKIIRAKEIIEEKYPELNIDGELQADAAIIPEIAESKSPGSKVAGKANVLIFPDLNSGNIAYKLVQRLAKSEAFGPVLQGLEKPVNDLSRGCDSNDIVNVAAITIASSI